MCLQTRKTTQLLNIIPKRAERTPSCIQRLHTPSVGFRGGVKLDFCDAPAEKGIKCLIITGYAFSLPSGATERYDMLLKPLRPVEIIEAVEPALRD